MAYLLYKKVMDNKKKYNQFYTPDDIALWCINKTKEVLGDKVTCWLEPSAGEGAFLKYLPADTLAYDIDPKAPNIRYQDYLTLDIPYVKGRCVIGNPPFTFNQYSQIYKKFITQSFNHSNYVAFILPYSQFNNRNWCKYHLLASYDLGVITFSDVKIPVCFNIYESKIVQKEPKITLQCVNIINSTRGIKLFNSPCDLRVCGYGSFGKISQYPNQYCSEWCFLIHEKFRQQVIDLVTSTNWKEIFHIKSHSCISVQQLLKYIKEKIPDIY